MAESGTNFTRGCWIDLFEAPHHRGKLRRIFGPALYLKIRWNEDESALQIDSMIVGPQAYVHVFSHDRPDRGGFWFIPNQQLVDFSQLKGEQELDSIRVLDRPPFHFEPGYSTFVRQTGKQQPDAPTQRKKRRGKR